MTRWRITAAGLIWAVGIWTAVVTTLVTGIVSIGGKPAERAVIGMGASLLIVWGGVGGLLMRRERDRMRAWVLAIRLPWRIKFVLFATCLALVEEVVTTTLTNLAPVFGVPVGKAYITASANYLDVVCLHSVVVFVPMFVVWSWLLGRYDFKPNQVFLLFGLTGALAEASSFGRITEAGFWIFIYGLMIYLPSYCLPDKRGAQPPRFWHFAMAVLLPFLAAAPMAGLVWLIHPVKIHFPPIGGAL